MTYIDSILELFFDLDRYMSTIYSLDVVLFRFYFVELFCTFSVLKVVCW